MTLPQPDPWLQYGALGLLALVLCGLGGLTAIALKMFGSLIKAVNGLAISIGESTAQQATQNGYVRAKLDSIEHDVSDRPSRPSPLPSERETYRAPRPPGKTVYGKRWPP